MQLLERRPNYSNSLFRSLICFSFSSVTTDSWTPPPLNFANSSSVITFGMNGGGSSLLASFKMSKGRKKGCASISAASPLLPRRYFLSLLSILVIKSWAYGVTENPWRSSSGQRIGAFYIR